jgi:hypothetical protein
MGLPLPPDNGIERSGTLSRASCAAQSSDRLAMIQRPQHSDTHMHQEVPTPIRCSAALVSLNGRMKIRA